MIMLLKHIVVWLLDVFYREPKMIIKYYLPFFRKSAVEHSSTYYFMADGKIKHGGMFDRLKGAISVYAVAKAQNCRFKINFISPFQLETYLVPRDYDWRVDEKEMVYSFPKSRPLFLYGECYAPRRVMKRRNRDAHFYFGYDILDQVNKKFHTQFEWGHLYRELFKPSPYLQAYIDHYQQDVGRNYFVVHTRFLNLLGDKTETMNNPELSKDEKQSIMRCISDKIVELTVVHQGLRVMLASDSMTFLDYIKGIIPDAYVVPGTVKHIGTSAEVDDAENIKMFLDYYLMGNAQKVYGIMSEGMWPSAFPEYAAVIGGVEFVRIIVDFPRV